MANIPYERPSDEMILLADVEGSAPPEKVLQVSVIGAHAFLTISSFREENKTATMENIASIQVDGEYLINAMLTAQRHHVRFSKRRAREEHEAALRRAVQ